MSAHTNRSEWSLEEVDSLENIDKEVQLVSTSPESHSNHAQEKGSVSNVKGMFDHSFTNNARAIKQQFNQNSLNLNSNLSGKRYSSCDDLSLWTKETKFEFIDNGTKINRSATSVNLKHNKKSTSYKYDHVQSKVKYYFNNSKEKLDSAPPKSVISDKKKTSDKEDYLEQVNRQLAKELDEKNAILSLLQENYERLLFKYAEAQNRIDELRFKVMTETNDSKISTSQTKQTDSSHLSYNFEYTPKISDSKCQKAVVAPFIKSEQPVLENLVPSVSRPSSLPLENNLKIIEKDFIKATTPTDSEGLSSIITSMSGHSKILNSLDEENQINQKSSYLNYQSNNFILEKNGPANDPFDKVKNWQNSLPPLEQIETPETTLYNVFSNNTEAYSSSETKYKRLSPKIEKDFLYSDESCPDSWREERHTEYRNDLNRPNSQDTNKNSLRALSLPNTLTKRNVMYQKPHHSLDVCAAENQRFEDNAFDKIGKIQTSKNDVPSSCIIHRKQKKPPLLRCSSLPAYDQDSVKSGNCKNGIYIPPLDLGNVTLSDDESYCQQEYYLNNSNTATSSSFVTSRGGSIDRSIQTPQSFSSCKATISEENSYSRVPKQTFSKSTSITPERSRAMDFFFAQKYDTPRRKAPDCIKECGECCSDKSRNRCNVCGESISDSRSTDFYRNRSNSCESIHNTDTSRNETPPRRTKPPFKRSVSFGSETLTPKFVLRDDVTPRNFLPGLSQDSLDNFDVYASNLKARSQVVIKALTAHVNSCSP